MPKDWTTGPAKWAAVLVLGAASIGGLGWSIFNREHGSLRALPRIAAEPSDGESAEGDGVTVTPAAPTAPRAHGPSHVIDLNTATAAELDLLPGIGPAMAGRIIDYRTQHGPFASVDQLDNVKGIGPRTLERLRPLVKVETASEPAPAPGSAPP